MDFSNNGALETMKWGLGQTPGTPPSALYIKLHIGDPGADGLLNPAAETLRVVVSFAAAANTNTDGRAQAVTDADVDWLQVAAAESYSHMSVWDDISAGACWYKGALAAPVAVAAGSNFTFPAGSTLDQT